MAEDDPAENGAEGPDEPDSFEEELVEHVAENDVAVETGLEESPDGDGYQVKRTAAFAELADRPKRKAIDAEQFKNDVKFFDDLRKFDAELAGTIFAQSQAAAAGLSVTHPAIDNFESEIPSLEEKILEDCKQLIEDLNVAKDGMTYFRNLLVHGNDVSHIEYDVDEGVVDITPLPLRALTILDEEAYREQDSMRERSGGADQFDKTITDADWYVLNEGQDNQDEFPAHDILHVALNRRGNWHKDIKGRDTFNVWGERRLEPVRYSLQAKQNTLANKVAMDDKLLAREFYYISVEELFGHIEDPARRQQKAEEYAAELRQMIEDLDADQKPVLPEEVTVEVEGPDGQTARNMADFIQTMNDSIQHALTYHVGAFGRDAGGTDRANKPAKEMSDNSVRQLRNIVKTAFKRLFEIHAILNYEEAREVVDPDADDISRYELADDVTLPVLDFDPVDPQEQAEKVRNAISLYEKGVVELNEARAFVDLEPVSDDEIEDLPFFKKPGAEEEEAPPGDDESQPVDEEQEEQENEQDDSNGNRRSYPTDSDSMDTIDAYETDPDEWEDLGAGGVDRTPHCGSCDSAVPEDADECPNCGEDFTEE